MDHPRTDPVVKKLHELYDKWGKTEEAAKWVGNDP